MARPIIHGLGGRRFETIGNVTYLPWCSSDHEQPELPDSIDPLIVTMRQIRRSADAIVDDIRKDRLEAIISSSSEIANRWRSFSRSHSRAESTVR